jgi:hypothetical protein
MAANRNVPTETRHWNTKNLVIFVLIWFGEAILILKFLKWMIRGSAIPYLVMIPWAFICLLVVVSPNWVTRMTRKVDERAERDMQRLDKWTPPGFP